jgi:hypothetical protein
VVVDSTTLEIEPPMPICVLTLQVISWEDSRGVPAGRNGGSPAIRVYTKDTSIASLKGGTLKASVTLRGSGEAERLWLVQVLDSSAPR